MIDNETVKKVAFLSRIKIDDDKIEATKNEFNKILDWVEQLKEVDASGIEPLVSVTDGNLALREDVACKETSAKDVLKNAPMSEGGYFVVPKVVE